MTAWATCRASPAGCRTCGTWAWTRCGCRRSTPPRRPTAATTWPTTARSTRCSARSTTPTTLIVDAHALGLRVIVDLVPNHCSDQHEWFKRALRRRAPDRRCGSGSTSVRRARAANCRPTTGSPSSAARPGPGLTADGEWYLHLFAPEQPDFNWDHPAVQDEFRSASCGSGWTWASTASGSTWRTAWSRPRACPTSAGAGSRSLLVGDRCRSSTRTACTRSTANGAPSGRVPARADRRRRGVDCPTIERAARYVRPGELHQAFNFEFLGAPWDAARAARGHRQLAGTRWARSAPPPPGCCPTTTSSGTPPGSPPGSAAPPAGRRRRWRAPADRELGLRRARAATLLMLALPGSAYLYQGEELGLPEVIDLPARSRQDPSFTGATGGTARARRLPGAAPVVRHRGPVRLRRGGHGPVAAAARLLGGAERRGAAGIRVVHPGAVPRRAAAAAGAAGAGRWRAALAVRPRRRGPDLRATRP